MIAALGGSGGECALPNSRGRGLLCERSRSALGPAAIEGWMPPDEIRLCGGLDIRTAVRRMEAECGGARSAWLPRSTPRRAIPAVDDRRCQARSVGSTPESSKGRLSLRGTATSSFMHQRSRERDTGCARGRLEVLDAVLVSADQSSAGLAAILRQRSHRDRADAADLARLVDRFRAR